MDMKYFSFILLISFLKKIHFYYFFVLKKKNHLLNKSRGQLEVAFLEAGAISFATI